MSRIETTGKKVPRKELSEKKEISKGVKTPRESEKNSESVSPRYRRNYQKTTYRNKNNRNNSNGGRHRQF